MLKKLAWLGDIPAVLRVNSVKACKGLCVLRLLTVSSGILSSQATRFWRDLRSNLLLSRDLTTGEYLLIREFDGNYCTTLFVVRDRLSHKEDVQEVVHILGTSRGMLLRHGWL